MPDGFDPVDLVHPQEEQAAAGLDDEPIGARLIAAQVLDEGQQAAAEVAGFFAFDLPARALERVGEALAIEGLEDVVEGAHLEGLEGVLIVGGHEDDERHALAPDRFDDLEAVHVRHLDIEEDELRRVIQDRRHGFLAVTTLAHHLDVGLARQQGRQPLARERLVVHDQGLDLFQGGGPMHVSRGGLLRDRWCRDAIDVHGDLEKCRIGEYRTSNLERRTPNPEPTIDAVWRSRADRRRPLAASP